MDIPAKLLKMATELVKNNAYKKNLKNSAEPLHEGVFDKSDSPPAKNFTFGFGKAAIIPEEKIPNKKKTYYIAGYRINNPAVGVLDEQMAKALWIDDNSGRGGVVFVSVDCVGLFGVDVAEIRKRLEHFCVITGCRSVNICSTHCHAGIDTMGMWGPLPKTGRDKAFMEILFQSVISAVEQAYKTRTSGQIYLGYGKADKGSQNAGRPPHVVSDVITRLRFVPDNGAKEVYMINFASHPESLEGKNSLVSADFPCYMAKYIDEHKNAEMMYFAGAIGGISMHAMDKNNIISTIKTGTRLAEIICDIKEEKKLTPKINILRQELYLSCDNPVFWAVSKFGVIPEKMIVTGKGKLNLGMKAEMSYIEFGELNMLLIPGELFPELAYGGYLSKEESSIDASPDINPDPLCKIADDENLLIFGLANGEIGYILTPNDYLLHPSLPFIEQPKDKFGRNHYPETNSLGPETAYYIADTFRQMIKKINK